MKLKSRKEAGRMLSKLLTQYENSDVLILAIPRGGVLVAIEIAKILNLDMDLIISKKILHPDHPNLAIGAIAQDGNPVFETSDTSNIELKWLNQEVLKGREEIARRHRIYNQHDSPLNLEGRKVMIVSDGTITGLSLIAAIEEVYRLKASKIIVATPGTNVEAARRLKPMVDKLVVINVDQDPVSQIDDYYELEKEIDDNVVNEALQEFYRERN